MVTWLARGSVAAGMPGRLAPASGVAPGTPVEVTTGADGVAHELTTSGEYTRMGSVIKKRRKRMAKKKHRKLLKKTRVQRRNKK
jgi:hypothetical protein